MSASPLIGPAESLRAARSLVLAKRAYNRMRGRKPSGMLPIEYPGRNVGKPAGSHIDELASQRMTLVLCWACQPKFSHKRHHYYKDQKFPFVRGKCDGCRKHSERAKIYLHESFLTDPGGRTTSGQIWTPA